MDLDTLSMDRAEARKAFLEYRDAFRQQGQEIDAELMRGYRALAGGKQLIRLSQTIRRGGVDGDGKPKLAVARADERRITFSRITAGSVTYTPGGTTRIASRRIRVDDALPPGGPWIVDGTWWATMPIIPPRLRPPYNLSNYHVLWEAVWTRGVRRAPGDPALLRRLGGDLWVVLATWDLSPLEKAVLEMR